MKTKNLVLGAVASIFAVGAAFASVLVTPQYVRIGPVPPTSNCKQVTAEDCGQVGSRQCLVAIDGTNYPAYLNSACTSAVMTTLTTPVEGEFVNP